MNPLTDPFMYFWMFGIFGSLILSCVAIPGLYNQNPFIKFCGFVLIVVWFLFWTAPGWIQYIHGWQASFAVHN